MKAVVLTIDTGNSCSITYKGRVFPEAIFRVQFFSENTADLKLKIRRFIHDLEINHFVGYEEQAQQLQNALTMYEASTDPTGYYWVSPAEDRPRLEQTITAQLKHYNLVLLA